MAIVSLNKSEVKKIVGDMNDEKLESTLSMFGTAVERITSEEAEVEVAPNRPDMLSAQGIYRALKTYFGKKQKEYKVNAPGKDFEVKIDPGLKGIRPYTACAIVKNLKFNDAQIKEIIDIQEKLHATIGRNRKKLAIGIYPLEKIKLPISFKAELPDKIKFIPLEMPQEMTGRQILSRHPTGREYAYLLENLSKYPVFRDAKEDVLSMPPIINSQMTGKVTEETKDIFIECSGFDLKVLQKTINILVTALADMGGEIYGMKLDYEGNKIISPNLDSEKIKINIKDAEKLLGIPLNEELVKKLLERMGYSYSKGVAEIPAYRADILHPADIYEDIAIAYGYDKFTPEIPEIATIGQESESEMKKKKIAEILSGLGLLEISTYHLSTKEDIKNLGIKKAIEVLESKTDYNMLRPNLLINSLKTLGENTDAKYPQKIFESGKVFEANGEDIEEKEKLCIAVSGETDFTEIKQIFDYLARMLGKEYKIEEAEDSAFIEGRCGKIMINDKAIGILGEISPNILKAFNLKMPSVALEVNLEEL